MCRARPEKADKMKQCDRLNSIKTTLAYAEQKRKATIKDVLLFRCLCDLVTMKRKEAQKQICITNFFKK